MCVCVFEFRNSVSYVMHSTSMVMGREEVTLEISFDLRRLLASSSVSRSLPPRSSAVALHGRRPSGRRPLHAAAGILVPGRRCPTPTP